jgi:RNA recognition motif-containing protein
MESHGVFVGDLSYFATEQDLIQLFSAYGPIDSVMIRRGKSGDTLHYGFVKMNEICAQTAISSLQGCKFLGRKLRLNLLSQATHTHSEKNTWAQIHVSFLAKSVRHQVNEEYLDNIFSQIGMVVDCIVKQYRLEVNPHKQSGYGFVYFLNIDDALVAIKSFKNKIIDGIQLDCNFSSESDAIKYAGRLEELYRSSPSYGPQHHRPEVLKFKPQPFSNDFFGDTNTQNNGLSVPFVSQHATPSYLIHPAAGSNPSSSPMMSMIPSGSQGAHTRPGTIPIPSHIVIPPVQQQQLLVPPTFTRDGSSPSSYQMLTPPGGSPAMYILQQQHNQGSYHHGMMPSVPVKFDGLNNSSLSMSSMSSSPNGYSNSTQNQVYHHPGTTFIY